MFSYEERFTAVKLYLKYESWSAVINELGYPSVGALRQWVKQYNNTNKLQRTRRRVTKYTKEQKDKAIRYYLEHGKNVAKTVRELGYPCRYYLDQWIQEEISEHKKPCRSSKSLVQLSNEMKIQAVMEFCAREESVYTISKKYGVDRVSLYNWKKTMLGNKEIKPMSKIITKTSVEELQIEVSKLAKQADELSQQVYQLQLEKDILEKSAEVIKKEQGIKFQTLTNKEKTIVIDALRETYKLKELLSVFHMAKSSYCYHRNTMLTPDKYEKAREWIKTSFINSSRAYGYRRVYLDIIADNHILSEKVIRRLMKEEKLIVCSIKKKKYNSYMGEITEASANIINRDFHSDKPNMKWLTDITEFNIPSGKIYLSPIIDCFDGLPVAWTIGRHPNAELVNTMLDNAISTLKDGSKPIVHSDRGAHYRWTGWIERMDTAGLTRSMSKKGCSPDNAACEGFFGRLKNEMFYGRSWLGVTIDEFIERLDQYIHWYAEKRRKITLGGLSPLEYRKSLGLLVA